VQGNPAHNGYPSTLRCITFGLLSCLCVWVQAEVIRDPLEVRALAEPQAVLNELPAALKIARDAGDSKRVALLLLAKANACRVIANWPCQRTAGEEARRAAELASVPELAVRGMIAQARGNLALKDYTRANEQLAEAEARLQQYPNTELAADVDLGFSSLAFAIGKHASARDYAQRGISRLAQEPAPGMRIRLLRNMARAQAQLGQLSEAKRSLERALSVSGNNDDPKLVAEIHLETARIARLRADLATQRESGERVLQLAKKLSNSQLQGLGLEVLALAELDALNSVEAKRLFGESVAAFRSLGLDRDELRVARELIALVVDPTEVKRSVARVLQLDREIAQADRAQAADDFAARIDYAESQTSIARLEGEQKLALERERLLKHSAQLTRWVAILSLLLIMGLAVWFWAQRRLNAKLSSLLKARSLALMNTSHELRNPINGVMGLSELLLRTHLAPQQREMVAAMSNAGQSIGKLAQDLLDRGRIEEGRLRLKPTSNSLREVLKNCHLLHKPAALQKGLKFRLELDTNVPDQLLFDDHRLQQVLTNLLVNSIKFTERGEISLRASSKDTTNDDASVQFTIADSGVGINSADLGQIFEPFRKGRAGDRHRAGAGLGLAISRDLVSLMGGELRVSSDPGIGTKMSFTLKFKRAKVTDPSGPTLPKVPVVKGIRILLVEDDPDVAMLMEHQLNVLGNLTTVAHSAKEALAAVANASFELLLIDAELPDSSGPILAAQLREILKKAQQTPRIAIVSGHDAPDDLPAGIDEWATKPVGLDRLNMLLYAARA